MAGRVKVDLDELEDTCRSLTGLLDHLGETIHQVNQAVAELHASWTGESAAAHHKNHLQWVSRANLLKATLASIRDDVSTALASYQAARDANSNMFRGR